MTKRTNRSAAIRRGFRATTVGMAIIGTIFIGANIPGSASASDVNISVPVVSPAPTPAPVIEVPVVIPVGVPLASVTVTISLSGLEPFSFVQVFAHSDPVLLASGFADAVGAFETSVSLPPSLPAGDHAISLQNTLSNGTIVETTLTTFSVSAGGQTGPPPTPPTDGQLTLVVAENSAATFESPRLNGNVSITPGVLGQFSVLDERYVSQAGWTLTANVATFRLATNPSTVIENTNLGLVPLLIDGSSTAADVTLGSPTIAGTATYPMMFAEGAVGSATGLTVLNGNLTLKAPAHLPVGTYTSTVTLTLASK